MRESGQQTASPPSSWNDVVIGGVLCIVTFAAAWIYTLPSPYFLDSFGYLIGIDKWNRSGEISSHYRFANTLLYYLPVTAFGEIGLKVVGVAFTTATAGTYFAMVRRDFSSIAAVGATLLLLSAPSTVITATHLKEDLTSLVFFCVAILLIRPHAGLLRTFCVGSAYGFALLFKEIMLGAAPFLVAYLHLEGEQVQRYRDCLQVPAIARTALRGLAVAAGAIATVLIVSPNRLSDFTTMASSPYMGQFYGLFSHQQSRGLAFWSEALLHLHPWYLFPVSFFLATLADRPPKQLLYPIMALVLLLFLANVSVIRMRHYVPVFFFLAPVLFDGIRAIFDLLFELLRRADHLRRYSGAFALASCAAVAVAQLAYVYPTLDYRHRYDPSRGFYRPLADALPTDALLLGMDNCPIATYESGLECRTHPPDLDALAARRYTESIADQSTSRPIYLLPDFFDYDAAGHIRRAVEANLSMQSSYSGWWEPYHVMTYGAAVDELIARRERQLPGCVSAERRQTQVEISDDLVLDEIQVVFRCDDGGERRFVARTHRGHRTHLIRKSVSRALPK